MKPQWLNLSLEQQTAIREGLFPSELAGYGWRWCFKMFAAMLDEGMIQ